MTLFPLSRTVLAACMIIGCAVRADEASVVVDTGTPSLEKPVLRTEADLVKGKANVKGVVNEIHSFFENTGEMPLNTASRPLYNQPLLKIVKEPDGRATLVYRSRYTSAKDIFRAVDGIASGSALIEFIQSRNLIIINDKSDRIEYYKDTLLALDVPSPQILIEAKVIEVLFNDGMRRNLSLTFNNERGRVGATTSIPGENQSVNGLNGSWSIIGGEDNLDVSFQWLLTAQDAKVLSSPNILVSVNEVARIVTGQDIPIQSSTLNGNTLSISTTFKRVGVSLEVEPQLINSDDVTLRVFPQVTTVLRYENISTGSGTVSYAVPVISVRNVESHLRMQDRQVVVIGGLYSSRDSMQEERVPVLSDLPLIGELFTGKNKSVEIVQLVFFMKIHIVPPEMVAEGYTFDPGYQARSTEDVGNFVEQNLKLPRHNSGVGGLWEEMKDSLPDSWRRKDSGESETFEPRKPAETAPEAGAAAESGEK